MTKTQKHSTTSIFAVIIWGLATSFFFYKNILEVSPGVMANDFMRAFHVDGAMLGNIAAAYFYAYLIMQIPIGILVDRFGARRLTTFAIGLCAGGTYLLAHAHGIASAATGRFVTGLGASFAAISCFKLTTAWFTPKRFAMMSGFMMSAAMLGSVGGVAPLAAAIAHVGWRHTLAYIAVAGFVLMLFFWLIVRDKGPYLDLEHTKQSEAPLLEGLMKVIKNPQTWHLSWYSGLAYAPMMIFGGLWGVPFLQSAYHFSHADAANEISMVFIGFAFGCPLAGWLSDYIGRRKPIMMWGTIVALIVSLFILYWPNIAPWLLAVLMFVFGFCISTFLLCFSMIREVNTLILTATAIGFMNAFDALLGGISDPLIGTLLDLGWKGKMVKGAHIFPLPDFNIALLTLPLYLAVALVFLLFIKETYCQPLKES